MSDGTRVNGYSKPSKPTQRLLDVEPYDSASDQLLAQEALAAARAFLEEAGTSRS